MSTPPPPLVFAQAIAPLLLGSIFASPLYGIALAQGISYYRSYPRDNKFVKCSVALLLLIDSVHMFSLANAVLVWYLRAVPDSQYPPSMIASTFASYVTTALVQSAFTLRVWILYEKQWAVPSIIGVLVLCQLGGGLGMAVNMGVSGSFNDVHDANSTIFGNLELASAMICDLMICITLVYSLRKNRSGIKASDAMIDKLIFYFIGISTLSSVFALLNLVTWVAMPNNIIFVIFHSIISKLYVNSLLVTLNSRQQFRRNLSNSNGVDTSKEDGVIPLSTFVAEA
ncbi:DUF6534 domain-containing protein [Pleurotus pulmonarius]